MGWWYAYLEKLLTELLWLRIESLKGSYEYESEKPGSVQSDNILIGFTLSQATKALRKSRGVALLYFRPLH